MKYFISYRPAHEKVSKVGQWTMWESQWSRVKFVSNDKTVILHNVFYPVRIEYLDRYFKVLRSQHLQQALIRDLYVSDEAYQNDLDAIASSEDILVPDEHWLDFLGKYILDENIVIKGITDGEFTKKAVPYDHANIRVDITKLKERSPESTKSGIEMVIDALHRAYLTTTTEHDDKFKNHELATAAIYSITKNTNLLGKTVPLPKRGDSQTLDDLAIAAATIVQEIDRILRNTHKK